MKEDINHIIYIPKCIIYYILGEWLHFSYDKYAFNNSCFNVPMDRETIATLNYFVTFNKSGDKCGIMSPLVLHYISDAVHSNMYSHIRLLTTLS